MKILVRSKNEAAELLENEQEKISALISIHSKGNTPFTKFDSETVIGFQEFPGPKLELIFDDAEETDMVKMGYSPPQQEDVQCLFDWHSKITIKPQDVILTHCAAGVSRSAACALAIYAKMGISTQDALRNVLQDRPQAWPNMLIIKHADDILSMGGELVKAIKIWKKKVSGILLQNWQQ